MTLLAIPTSLKAQTTLAARHAFELVGGSKTLPSRAKGTALRVIVYPDVVLSSYPRPQQLAEFAIKAHLPMMNAFRLFVDVGGLMS